MNTNKKSGIQINVYGEAENMSIVAINQLIRKHTAFKGVLDLVKSSRHSYRPSLNTNGKGKCKAELTTVANFYDSMMQRLGINKVAFRY